jgi:hypothetical protein
VEKKKPFHPVEESSFFHGTNGTNGTALTRNVQSMLQTQKTKLTRNAPPYHQTQNISGESGESGVEKRRFFNAVEESSFFHGTNGTNGTALTRNVIQCSKPKKPS